MSQIDNSSPILLVLNIIDHEPFSIDVLNGVLWRVLSHSLLNVRQNRLWSEAEPLSSSNDEWIAV